MPSDSRAEPIQWFALVWVVFPVAYIMYAIFVGTWVRHWVVESRVSRRRLAGQCTVCGYDLRASKERCPECGMAIPAAVHPLREG